MKPKDQARVFEINVEGTRIVLEEALRAGVVRVVHTSSVAAVGPAEPGGTADEDQPFTAGRLGIAYVNSKHEAESVAMRIGARGLPVVVVNPSFVLGPDDPTGTSNDLVRRLLLRRIPAYVDGALSIVDVRDVARGHLLADERGHEGERYILSGRNFTLQRLCSSGPGPRSPPPPTRSARGCSGGRTGTTRRAASWATSPGRTRRRWRTPSAGSSRSWASGLRGTTSRTRPCA
jgi:dihydroflavonol-4-reductase